MVGDFFGDPSGLIHKFLLLEFPVCLVVVLHSEKDTWSTPRVKVGVKCCLSSLKIGRFFELRRSELDASKGVLAKEWKSLVGRGIW